MLYVVCMSPIFSVVLTLKFNDQSKFYCSTNKIYFVKVYVVVYFVNLMFDNVIIFLLSNTDHLL